MTDPWDQPWGIAPSSKKVLSQQSSDRAKKCFRSNRAIEQKSAFAAIARSSKKVLSSYRAKSDRAKKCYRTIEQKNTFELFVCFTDEQT
jgi:hypothetical protein